MHLASGDVNSIDDLLRQHHVGKAPQQTLANGITVTVPPMSEATIALSSHLSSLCDGQVVRATITGS
jgi:hypothetical protein